MTEPSGTSIEKLLTVSDLANLFNKSVAGIEQWRYLGYLPPAVKVGRRIFWRRQDIEQWVASKVEAS